VRSMSRKIETKKALVCRSCCKIRNEA